ncbi:MAG: NAD(P)/FAD-dependent oxidoreductase [Tumebacillaceae bacterium]
MLTRADVLIIGGGPAGMTAAIWCKRLGLDHLLIEAGGELGGQLPHIHNPVFDYPGVYAANGSVVQERFIQHLDELQCARTLEARVQHVDAVHRVATVETAQGATEQIGWSGLIFATGAAERQLGVPGEAEMIQRGEVYSASRDRDRFAGKRVAVVGGGDRAFEGALLLAERGAEVVLIHRSDRLRARQEFVEPVLAHPRIEKRTHAVVEEILGSGRVEGVRVRERDGSVTTIPVEGVFVRVGVAPNSDLLKGQVKTDADGFVGIDAVGQTDRPGVFAVGDVCTRPLYSSIASAVGQAMIATKHLSFYLAQKGEEL